MKFMEKIRVMLAEDNQSILRLLSDFLSGKPEIELVAAVSDGAAILDAVREHGPDVLVMDVIMPRKDGFMALEELGRIDECARPKVIVLTGLSRDDFIMRAIALGASYYMVKPFDLHVLYHRILEVAGEEPDVVASSAPRGEAAEIRRRADHQSVPDAGHSRPHQGLSVSARGRAHGDGEPRRHQPHHQGALSRHRPGNSAPLPARSSAPCATPSRWPGRAAGWTR